MEASLAQVARIVKIIGSKPMLELEKSKIIQTALAIAIAAYPLAHLIVAIIEAVKP